MMRCMLRRPYGSSRLYCEIIPQTTTLPPQRMFRSAASSVAHVVDVDVDAVREAALERGGEVGLRLVVERVVEAELGLQKIDLLVGAGAADHVAAGDLGELPGDLPDGARRGRYEHEVASLRPPDLHKRRVCSEPCQAYHCLLVSDWQ